MEKQECPVQHDVEESKSNNKIKFWIKQHDKRLAHIIDSTPIVPAKEFIPEWWKKVPAHDMGCPGAPVDEKFRGQEYLLSAPSRLIPGHVTDEDKTRTTGTVKLCPAIHDWFSMGYVLPMWCDLEVNIVDDGRGGESGPKPYDVRAPSDKFHGGLIDHSTYIQWLPKEYQERGAVGFVSLECPWNMSTPPGISVFQFPMYYHFNPDFEVPPGPIWADEYSRVNPQIIVKHYGKFTIKRGTPLCVFIPYGRHSADHLEMELVRHPGEHEEIQEGKTDTIVETVFRGGYRQMQKEKNEI
jgi:hypothetical protein